MTFRTKILAISLGAVALTTTTGLLVQRSVIRRQGIDAIRAAMRTAMLGAEDTRESVSRMRQQHMFDESALAAEIRGATDYRATRLYKTVPVVAAWDALRVVADKEGYQFRVPTTAPRNPVNGATPEEQRILHALDGDQLPEYFEANDATNEVIYARPVVLSRDCLACHGDPAQSPTHDGKDLLGFRMEGWKEGDRHGAFMLRTKLDRVDAVVARGMWQTAVWLVPLSVALGVAIYVLLSRYTGKLLGLVQSIAESAHQVRSAVTEISQANQSLANGTAEQSKALDDTAHASDDVVTKTRSNAQGAGDAAAEMDRVDVQVHKSSEALKSMTASMADIQQASKKIENINKVIDEIAFQTNILALNATVEAARAGDAGVGFAVVADEVRKLAQRSAQAAQDTAPLVADSIAKANAGSRQLEQIAALVEGISENTAKAKALAGQVSEASRDQQRGMDRVTTAIHEMQRVTQEAAANSEQTAAASEELSAQAELLSTVATDLRAVVEG